MKPIEIYEEKRKSAIETLVRLGAARYVSDMDLYHGRAGNGSDWEVSPSFQNGGNATNNANISSISGLYAGSKDVAKKFANARACFTDKSAEVHKIVSYDEDAIVYDFTFNASSLNKEEMEAYRGAMLVLTKISLTEANPIKFEYRKSVDIIVKKIAEKQYENNTRPLTVVMVEEIIEELKCDKKLQVSFFYGGEELKKLVYRIVGSYNARYALGFNPRVVLSNYVEGNDTIRFDKPIGDCPIDSSFISAWCSANHIVGINLMVDSATIDETIPVCHLFDTKKVMTEKQRGLMLSKMLEQYDAISHSFEQIVDEQTTKLFKKGSSKEVLEFVRQDQRCNEIYDMDSYIWEGWNIGQHTRSTIDFFDSYYKESVPENLRPFIKICLLAHDMGKGYAQELDRDPKEMNGKYSSVVFDALNISREYRTLINFIIGDSQTHTSNILLGNGDKNKLMNELKADCQNAFCSSFGRFPTEKELKGLVGICVIIQECDSGSYTRYAKIDENGRMVGGGNDSFTSSFEVNSRGEPRIKRLK